MSDHEAYDADEKRAIRVAAMLSHMCTNLADGGPFQISKANLGALLGRAIRNSHISAIAWAADDTQDLAIIDTGEDRLGIIPVALVDNYKRVTLGDCRRAKAAIKQLEKDHGFNALMLPGTDDIDLPDE